MARTKKSKPGRGGRGGNKNQAGGAVQSAGTRMRYAPIVKENPRFERYYNSLFDFSDEERAEFWAAVRRELPNSFRFCGSKGHALAVKKLLIERYIPHIKSMTHDDGTTVEPPEPVPWYPDSLAWWMTTPKTVIRRFPPFAAFQRFLVSETSVGNISRQEVVSMIPPLLLDVRPGQVVLDMCAAPGSKAGQLLEMIHRGEEARMRWFQKGFADEDGHAATVAEHADQEKPADLDEDASDAGRATGLLIANDADYKRCHMLVHQLKRLSSPNLLVTNHDATMYPAIRLPDQDNKHVYLKFDRILADVPCSGDGTLRKNASLWKDWVPGSAIGLHITQTRILVRALQLLKPGGRVVYSTCSMNPVENEAVVASAIERCGGADKIEIVNCADQLPGLKRVPGMRDWKVMDKSGEMWNSWQEVEDYARQHGSELPGKVARTMFPRVAGQDCADLPLENCMRIYSHLQDTGGFFITALEKKADFRAKTEGDVLKSLTKVQSGEEKTSAEVEAKEESEEVPPETAAPVDVAVAPVNGGTKRPLEEEEEDVGESTGVAKEEDKSDETRDSKRTKVETPAEEAEVTATTATTTTDNTSTATTTPAADTPAAAPTTTTTTLTERPVKIRRGEAPPFEEPYKYLDAAHAVIADIAGFYHLSPRFPLTRFMVRNAAAEPTKAIYYTSALARDLLTENAGRGIRFVHGGVKMFMRQDAPAPDVCRWRIQSEGLALLQGYVGEARVVRLRSRAALQRLLREMFPRIAGDDWRLLGEDVGARVRDIGMGCCVLKVEARGRDDNDEEGFDEAMALPLWKSLASLNLMLPKEDRAAMLLRLYNDTAPLINNSMQNKQKNAAAAAAAAVEAADGEGEAMEEDAKEEEGEGDVDVEDIPTPEGMD